MKFFGNKWDDVLSDEFEKEYFVNLIERVENEYNIKKVYPPKSKVFSAMKVTDYDNVKVVIIGQDPYFNEGQAHGLAFSVLPGVATPPSLLNIYKEIKNEYNGYIPDNGYLMPWARQGVLLLNASLTVIAGEPNSHKNFGWETFTDAVIASLNNKKEPVVFLLWGANAKQKQKLIDTSKHFVLTASHPSPLSVSGFLGCGHFKKANEILVKNNMSPINWQIENLENKFI